MPNWTKDQERAITESGKNIIVSAGAGSGKTAVLTERVIRKLKKGENINNLLILTFTNATAKEMKERIRDAIKKENLLNQLEKLDSSFITTFDSFALSVVKKYHYLLNINSDVEIANDLILKFKKEEILEEIFSELYEEENQAFLKLISDFTTRDDTDIKNYLIDIYNKIDLKYDKNDYLNNYIDLFYNDIYIDKLINNWISWLNNNILKIKENLEQLELILDGDNYYKFKVVLDKLLNSKNYDEIKSNLDIKLPILRGNEEAKPYKDKIKLTLDELKHRCIYDSFGEIKDSFIKTKAYTEIILYILKELSNRFDNFKFANNLYDFIDISKLAIKIVDQFPEARMELKSDFHEILVDEYQDTSDLQELFINKISDNNVYMVGDIKQSIYRFRNANPNLFKEKYFSYSKNIDGIKIDLVKNFRSRSEVLNNINLIFNLIMDKDLGGADYKESHQMVFGNTAYLNYTNKNQNNNIEIYNYDSKDYEYSSDEIEAFIVVKDIKNKILNHYQVYDKNKNNLRDVNYSDFVILMDKSSSFDLYKKIFEYHNIPLTIIKEENVNNSYDLLILKNILVLLLKVKNNIYDKEFKYAYLSVGRSYLFRLSDQELYDHITSNNFLNDCILDKIKKISYILDETPINVLISKIISEFSIYENLIKVGNINDSIVRFDYIENLANNLCSLGYTYKDLINYFNKIIENNEKIAYSLNQEIDNSVKIMTIHKSKGLEFPICYYTGLLNNFNFSDTKKRFLFDNQYGIITPYISNGIKNTIIHDLYKNNYLKEDISERIRLFYVALTRSKEKMIMVTSLKENDDENILDFDTKIKYSSFRSILNSIKDKLNNYIKEYDLNTLNLTKDYNVFKVIDLENINVKSTNKIDVISIQSKNNILSKNRYSKSNNYLLTNQDVNNLKFGEKLHYIFEIFDFKKQDYEKILPKYQKYLKDFLANEIFKNIDEANIYKEYEFRYLKDNKINHGIIDLMIEYDNYIDIIDYKTKNISDTDYLKQLMGYQEYINLKTSKPVHIYLYSIINNHLFKIN